MLSFLTGSLVSRLIKPTVRHVAQALFGSLATYGVITESQVESGVGIAMSVALWLWMAIDKKRDN